MLPFVPGGNMLSLANKGLIAAQAPALYVEHESMVSYKKRVDALLDQLKGSKAEHGKFADGTLGAGDLGTGFTEAQGLHTAYNKVRSEMENLSKALANQIESLAIAIEASRVGYENMDEDVKARMRALQRQAHEQYVPGRDPEAPKPGEPAKDPASNGGQPSTGQGTNESTAGGDM
ncbi:hypothetical protein DEJ50_12275 [Streptomyces venezuelae]|uniref:Uncharacterized protein n=1 Tax=Streptomyces venezuelae TaxID=54571 RepID=A0A5P2D5Q3_STRVZ|nr:hypothetical protein DEJ50_12275 [Streptomyces venezuelae]